MQRYYGIYRTILNDDLVKTVLMLELYILQKEINQGTIKVSAAYFAVEKRGPWIRDGIHMPATQALQQLDSIISLFSSQNIFNHHAHPCVENFLKFYVLCRTSLQNKGFPRGVLGVVNVYLTSIKQLG